MSGEGVYHIIVQQATIGDERNSKTRSPQPVHEFNDVPTQKRFATAELDMIAAGALYEPGDPLRQRSR